MWGMEHLGLFILAGWLLNLTPGPDVLYIVSNALRSGVRAGVVAAFGITAGCFVHIFAAALGVGALLATSATAFAVLKWLGAGYLLYIGTRLLLSRAPSAMHLEAATAHSTGAAALKDIFFRGFWTNVLNPKVALFFLAFVPQFIAHDADNKTLAFVLLGVLFNLNAIPINVGYAVLAAWAAKRFSVAADRRAVPKVGEPPWGAATRVAAERGGLFIWLDRVAGALFVGFGVKLALTESP